MTHIMRIDEFVNESYEDWNEKYVRGGLDKNAKLSDDMTLFLQIDEQPTVNGEEEHDRFLDIYMYKEGIFNLKEWFDIDSFFEEWDDDTNSLKDESRELMKLYGTSYKIKVFAFGWEDDYDMYVRMEPERFSLEYDKDCDYSKFVKDFNGIKSQLIRECVFSAYWRFIESTFLTNKIDKKHGYEYVEY